MTDLTAISVISTAETALRRLKKAEIAVYRCKKQGAEFIFSVKDKDIKKVFAIFGKPCYNVKVITKSRKERILRFFKLRAGLIFGAVMFIAAVIFSNTLVLKIEISGSGSYLEPEVRRIVYDEGAREFKPLSGFNASVATGRILALPQVTFCNIQKKGSVLAVDVQVDGEHFQSVSRKPLIADTDGIVRNVVAVCGTAAVAAGDGVKAGDTLIYAHMLAGEKIVDCIAAGYAELECRGTTEFFAGSESEESLKSAYSSLLLEDGEILSRKHTVKPTDGGVIYVIDFTYLHKLSINLS